MILAGAITHARPLDVSALQLAMSLGCGRVCSFRGKLFFLGRTASKVDAILFTHTHLPAEMRTS